MSTGVAQFETDDIRACARLLADLERQAGEVQAMASDASPDPGTWGLVGIPFAIWYGNTAEDIHENLGHITECLGSKVAGLEATAEQYDLCEEGITEALSDIEQVLASGGAAAFAISAGPVDVIRLDPSEDIPIASSVANLVGSMHSSADSGDWTELSGAMGEALSLGTTAAAYLFDPLHVLISNGLGFLIDVIQPLEDALAWVTGNPERMQAEIDKWERVGQAQSPLAEAIRRAAADGLATWQGAAAQTAKARLLLFADGVAGTGDDIQKVTYILRIAQTTMEIAQAFVISLIATFVEWLVYTWVAALATAPFTFGGSTAAASAATAARLGHVLMRARNLISRVVLLLRRLRLVLTRLHGARMRRVQTSFQLRDRGRFVQGWVGSRRALVESLTNWRSYYDPAQRVVGGVVDEAARAAEGGSFVPESQAADRAHQLDPER